MQETCRAALPVKHIIRKCLRRLKLWDAGVARLAGGNGDVVGSQPGETASCLQAGQKNRLKVLTVPKRVEKTIKCSK